MSGNSHEEQAERQASFLENSKMAHALPQRNAQGLHMIEIEIANFPADSAEVRVIFREYAASIDVDLSFQDFEVELAALPGKFAAPRGRVLLARDGREVVGCVALRPLEGGIGEMKRLFVRPAGRGQQLGRRLAISIVEFARSAGYKAIRLDTLPSMTAALSVYASLGFERIPPYTFNPIEGAIFMECKLDKTENFN
jgi:ribosomal protein S18 acetylase RimI-like enzyme